MDPEYFCFETTKGQIHIEGDIDNSNVHDIISFVVHKKPNIIVMTFLEIDDGPTLAIFVTILREIAPITIVDAPQMLAHTIYKIHAMGVDKITLKNPRQGP